MKEGGGGGEGDSLWTMLIIELPETAKFRGLYKITNIKMLNQFPVSLFPSDI